MEHLWAIALGAVQGITEFLPVSSSGHLAAMQEILGMDGPRLLMNVALHAGTLGSILAVYRKDLVDLAAGSVRALQCMARVGGNPPDAVPGDRARLGTALHVLLATAVTAPVALLLEPRVEHMNHDMSSVGGLLLITASLLAGSRFLSMGIKQVGWFEAVAVGFIQGLAVLPGISRSGATIVVALMLGVSRESAVRFSFLAALPALAGALVLEGGLEPSEIASRWPVYLLGAAVSFAVGWGCLRLLIAMTEKRRLHYFAFYLVPLGLALMWVGR